MAIVQITPVIDGQIYALYRVYLHGENNNGGEVSDQVVIDPADFNPPGPNVPRIKIDEIWYDLSGFTVRLKFSGIPDQPIWTIGSSDTHVDFRDFGGLTDPSGLDGSGKLLLDTFGLDSPLKLGTLVIKVRKS